MASFVYAVWSITNVASMHCSVRPELSPCTCEPIYQSNTVDLFCERVDSFHQIVDALSNKFTPNISISLRISHSQLDDLEMRSFSEMNLNVRKLRLISNNLRSVPELPFRGLSDVEYLSLAENDLEEIPKHVLNHLPKVATLDLGKGRIKSVNADDFKGIPNVKSLILVSNQITKIDKNSFPQGVENLHLGRNQISTLNGTIKDLNELKYLFINMNNLTTLEGELPLGSENLQLILAINNSLEKLPQSMKKFQKLDAVFLENNKLKSFDGVFKHGKSIVRLKASHNEIEYLAEDEFQEAEMLQDLELAYNQIKALNKSLLPIKQLKMANFSFNELQEFSMNEVRGILNLTSLDISYNKIEKLTGRMENAIEPTSFLVEILLQHNRLKSLDGAFNGLNKLRLLNIAFNQIERILPDDFIGLESLELLDISHNQLLTLEETSTTFLPSLKYLRAAFNNLTILEKDFHGLPVLCQVNLTHNQIVSISSDLVSKTRCNNHGVAGKLEIWLENNPIMCDERIQALCPAMAIQDARIRGRSHCFETYPNNEICADPPIILNAPLPLIPQIIQTQLQQASIPAAHPSIVQVIVPSPNAAPPTVINAEIPNLGQSNIITIASPVMPMSQPLIAAPPIIPPHTTMHTAALITTSTTSPTATTTTTISPIPINITEPIIESTQDETVYFSTTDRTNDILSTFDPDPNTITTLKPDLGINSPENKDDVFDDDYAVIKLAPTNIDEIPPSIEETDSNHVQENFMPEVVVSKPENSRLLIASIDTLSSP